MNEYILEMRGITKEFPGVKALEDVGIRVRKGEIHCLVGENGAGKSTLMKVLSGVYPYGAYSGDILFEQEIQRFRNISDSEAKGIAIIYQELELIPELTVYENIFFAHELVEHGIINWNRTIVEAGKVLERVRLNVNPATKVKDLGVGNQQLVEIAKALSRDVKLLILDEPTAALNEDDSENLLGLLRQLKEQGITCIMISHRIKEVIRIADTVTILRDGKTVCEMDASEGRVKEQEIIRHMVGREIKNIYPQRRKNVGDVCFEVRGWTVYNPLNGREILHDINLTVRRGEIVGLAGLMGAGRTELAMSLFGNTPKYKLAGGQIFINGAPAYFPHPSDAIKKGLAYVTEDRKRNGLILIWDIRRNITIASIDRLIKRFVIDENKEIIAAGEVKESIGIKAPSVQQIVGNLSGGNQQKTSLAKWLFAEPSILILDEPTRGIDVGAKHDIYELMNRLVEQGMSIIMISSELLEILGMSDRVYTMAEGYITGELAAEEATEQKIMAMATRTEEDAI